MTDGSAAYRFSEDYFSAACNGVEYCTIVFCLFLVECMILGYFSRGFEQGYSAKLVKPVPVLVSNPKA